MDYLTSDQTIDIIEKLMVDSGIRNFCTDKCKGMCCGECYKYNKEACHLCEGRRLPCSLFLCTHIKIKINKKVTKSYWKMYDMIIEEYDKFCIKNHFFYKPDKKYKKEAKFPLEIKPLAEGMVEGLRQAMTEASPYIKLAKHAANKQHCQKKEKKKQLIKTTM